MEGAVALNHVLLPAVTYPYAGSGGRILGLEALRLQIDRQGLQAEADRRFEPIPSDGVKEGVPIPQPLVQFGGSSSTRFSLVGTDVPGGATIVELVLIEHAKP